MNVYINVIGPEITLKQEISLELVSPPTLRDVMRSLLEQKEGPWKRIVKNDLSLAEGCVALLKVYEGDEITLTVLLAGG
jgi:hypothetical protein